MERCWEEGRELVTCIWTTMTMTVRMTMTITMIRKQQRALSTTTSPFPLSRLRTLHNPSLLDTQASSHNNHSPSMETRILRHGQRTRVIGLQAPCMWLSKLALYLYHIPHESLSHRFSLSPLPQPRSPSPLDQIPPAPDSRDRTDSVLNPKPWHGQTPMSQARWQQCQYQYVQRTRLK